MHILGEKYSYGCFKYFGFLGIMTIKKIKMAYTVPKNFRIQEIFA